MSIEVNKDFFSNEGIILEYNQYKVKYDEYEFKKDDVKNDIKDIENKIENQKNFKSRINKIAIGIIISGSLIGVAAAITASVIVIGGALKAFVLSSVLIAVLIASFVFFLIAMVSLIVSICLFAFAKKPLKKIAEYEGEILEHQNSLSDLEKQNPLKDLKKPFIPFQGSSYNATDEVNKVWKECKPSLEGKEYWIKVYSSVKRLYEDVFKIKEYELEEDKENDLRFFNQFRKYFSANKFFTRGGPLSIVGDHYWFLIYGKKEKINFKGEFLKDVSKIISNNNKTNKEKIELIEFHPLITITKCLNELYARFPQISGMVKEFYLGIFDEYVDRFENDSEFYNLFVIKIFEKIYDNYSVKKTVEKIVKHVSSKEQMEDILSKADLMKNEELVKYRHDKDKTGSYYVKGRYIEPPKILKDEIIEALKEAWKEKTNQNF